MMVVIFINNDINYYILNDKDNNDYHNSGIYNNMTKMTKSIILIKILVLPYRLKKARRNTQRPKTNYEENGDRQAH